MTAEVLGVPYEFKKCDLMAGENMKVNDAVYVDAVSVCLLTHKKVKRRFLIDHGPIYGFACLSLTNYKLRHLLQT